MISPDSPESVRELRTRIDVPVCGGEIITTPGEMIGRMEAGDVGWMERSAMSMRATGSREGTRVHCSRRRRDMDPWLAVRSPGSRADRGTPGDARPMSLQSVRSFLAEHAPDIEIIEMPTSTATVLEAAQAHGVTPAQIAKTLSLRLNDEVILLVVGGDARIDNRKYKNTFGGKAVMLPAGEVLQWTGHPVGGVCPFGLPRAIRVFADVTLRTFDVVLPAAGATNAALRIDPARLAELVRAEWVDVAQAKPEG
jgi:prolyl-tRNA editing enzyme YbaK/EbsC (Cys-tRNA(Pro) deacylase)